MRIKSELHNSGLAYSFHLESPFRLRASAGSNEQTGVQRSRSDSDNALTREEYQESIALAVTSSSTAMWVQNALAKGHPVVLEIG